MEELQYSHKREKRELESLIEDLRNQLNTKESTENSLMRSFEDYQSKLSMQKVIF